ncbi:MAG TPA: SpaA isopeptide-forming pilin-related protein [Clostridiaceae bacterium]|nr:SpaA isopeptide-forming pilin-related protein [Clostridiaceae bacterium]
MLKIKKIISILMIMLTLLSVMQPVFAASGTGTWSGGQYASGFKTTDNQNGNTGILIRKLTNTVTGEKRTVFCAEHGVEFITGRSYNGKYYTVTDKTIKKACKIAYLGWYKANPYYVVDGGILDDSWAYETRLSYVFTQQYIWQTLGQSNATFIDSNIQARYENFKNNIESQIADMERKPSFDKKTITIQAGESKTIEDTNGELAKYNSIDRTQDGIRFKHNKGENTLTISVDENTNLENYKLSNDLLKSWGMIKEGTEDLDSNVYFEFADGVQNQLYALNYNDPVTLQFGLAIELYGKLELSKLNSNGDLVSGAKFRVTGPNYDKEVEVTNGKITIDKLKKGTYTIKEVSVPKGYLLNTKSYNVEIKPNQTSTQAISNSEPTGKIILRKTDKYTGNTPRVIGTTHHGDASLNGAVYSVYAKTDIYNTAKTIQYFKANEKIAEFKFDANGKANVKVTTDTTKVKLETADNTLKGLPLGDYYAKETTTPVGYKDDTNTYDFNLSYKDDKTSEIALDKTAEEEVKRAKFNVIKISSNENKTADTIKDAEFTAILSKYVEHYGSFDEAKKHLSEFYSDEYSIFKTDENGHGISGFLAYGEYEVRETSTPSDKIETVEPFYININKNSDGSIKEFVENDLPFESYVKLIKEDKVTGKKVTLSNATFKLYRLNDKNQWEKVYCKNGIFKVDSWKTGKDGVAYTEDKLKAGKYKADEIKIPDGFLKLDSPVEFEINRSNKTLEFDKDYDAYISVVLKNEQPTGTLKLDKTIAIRNDVDTSLVDTSDLSKIKFKLTAKENIIDKADGKVIYAKGKEVRTYNLSKDGKLEVSKLPMGIYELQEIETLPGLVLDNTKYEVNFKKTDDTTKVYTIEKKIKNDTTCVEVSKTDITGDKELKGAKLSVIDENNKIIDTWTSTDKTHKIEGLLVGKTYTLREEIAPDGYVKATNIKFNIENNNKIQKVKMIDKVVTMSKKDIGDKEVEGAKIQVLDKNNKVVDEWTSNKEEHKIKNLVENETYTLHEEVAPNGYVKATDVTFKVTEDKKTQKVSMIDKIVEISKTDITTGKELEGAKLTVTDENGKVVDEWTSSEESHKVTGLEESKKYTLTETTCPYGYEQAESITFEVSKDKKTQKVVMKDQPILKNVKVIKIDTDTKEQIKEKFVFGIYKDSECKDMIQELKSNNGDGFVEFKDLRYETYYIKELKAPVGYELSNRVAKVEINDKGIFVDNSQVEEKDGTIEFNFENKHIEIPKTGDNSHIKLAVGIIILSILGLALLFIKLFKNK